MYNQERELKKIRVIVRNKARVEDCIAEAFTCKEITNFSSKYFSRANNMNTHTTQYHMVEVKHESLYLGNNLLFVHQMQQVYYLSYPHESMKHWWVVYKVNPEMDTRQYDTYMEIHDDDDVVHIYQEENKETKVYISLYLMGRNLQN
jgi:hypothetical protein